ncbi:hypothetical protein JCM15519_16820 [Fundidesulfovibrio butyratiphilus]
MSSNIKINNFAKTTLALGCTSTDTTLNVADASVFPSITGDEYFFLVLEDASLNREIVKCTSKAANVLTVERAQESTTARAWNQGDRVALRLTAGTLEARLSEILTALTTRLETVESSLESFIESFKIGEVIPWPTEVVPAKCIAANGAQNLSRTAYSKLYGVYGTRYGVGDGVNTFGIPDYRGEFLRGDDNGAGHDPDAATRTNRGDGTTGSVVGTKQAESLKKHNHPMGNGGGADGGAAKLDYQAWNKSGSPYNIYTLDMTATGDAINPNAFANVPQGLETRPRNVSVTWIIRYE